MSVDLIYKHQQNTYKMMKEALETSSKAAYIYPTGCGKSFPALKYIEDNPEKKASIVVPSNFIKKQFERNIIKYVENGAERLKNGSIKIMTYQKNVFKNKRKTELNNKIKNSIIRRNYPLDKRFGLSRKFEIPESDSDIVIFDEIHRMGAKTWETAVDQMMKKNPNRKIIGMTATPERTDKRNMAYEKFGEDIVYEMSLTEALSGEKEGEVLLKTPNYIRVLSQLKVDLPKYQEQIELIEDKTLKEKYVGIFKKLETIVSNSPDIQDIMLAGMKKKNGKYIVFCKDRDDLLDKIELANEIFGKVNSKINIDYVLSKKQGKKQEQDKIGKTKIQNEETLEDFELRENGDGLNLLFCVDMLNEGVHLEGIDGEILFDLTTSPILYKQRIGRVLSSDKDAGETVIIDVVNNWINQIDTYREIEKSTYVGTHKDNLNEKDNNNENDFYDLMKLTPVETELLEILREIGEVYKYTNSISLNRALEIQEWCKETFKDKKVYERRYPSSTLPDEKKLAYSLADIKRNVVIKYKNKELDEIESLVDRKIVEIIRELDHDYGRYGSLYGKSPLGVALETLELCENTFKDKKVYERRLPGTGKNSSEDEKRKMMAFQNARSKLKAIYSNKKPEEIEDEMHRDAIKIIKIIEAEYEIYGSSYGKSPYGNLLEIQEWCEETFKNKKVYERKLPSSTSSDEREKRLGRALGEVKNVVLKKYKNNQLEEIDSEIDRRNVELLRKLINEYGLYNTGRGRTLLGSAIELKEWCEETYKDKKVYERKLPDDKSTDKIEKSAGETSMRIRSYIAKTLYFDENDKKAIEIYEYIRREYGLYYIGDKRTQLGLALELQEWCDESNRNKKEFDKRLPNGGSSDKTEKRLAESYTFIKQNTLKQYQGIPLNKIENDEDRKIVEIIRHLEEQYGKYIAGNSRRTHLGNALEILDWCQEMSEKVSADSRRLPSADSEDEKERNLSKALERLIKGIVVKYNNAELEEIKNEDDRQVVAIVRKIYSEYASKSEKDNFDKRIEKRLKKTISTQVANISQTREELELESEIEIEEK